MVPGTDKGVAKDKEQTSVPQSLSSGRPPIAMAVLPHEVTGRTAAVGASFVGADLFNLGEERVPGVAWAWRLARVLGGAMVVVFFGWLVTKLGGYIRIYICKFESTAHNIKFRWHVEDRIWQ